MVSPFPIKMHYGEFEKGNTEKEILILCLEYISKSKLLLLENRIVILDNNQFNILITVVGNEKLRSHFIHVVELLCSFSVRIRIHVYCQDSLISSAHRSVRFEFPDQLFFHIMKSPAGTGTIIERQKVSEALMRECGNAIILVDLDNIR